MPKTILPRRLCWSVPASVAALLALLPARAAEEVKARTRRPVALVVADDGKWLFAANQRAGSVSVIDAPAARLRDEVAVGGRPSDLVATPDGRHLLAADEEAHELVLLARRGPRLEPAGRLRVAPYPVAVAVARDGSRAYVASLWSRRLTVVDLAPALRVARTVALPFAPRKLLAAGDKLIVADSFGGQFAVCGPGGEVESVRTLPGHNVRGVALGPGGKDVLLAHQILAGTARTTLDNIHWGNLLTNNVRALPLSAVLDPKGDPLAGGRLHQLDEVLRGAADPSGLAVTARGDIAVTLGGTDELALTPRGEDGVRLRVGRRPTAVVAAPDGRRLYVANTFADSVSVVDVAGRKVLAEVSLGKHAEPSLADRGEMAFYDSRLSHDGWLSCHSCHTDGHANGLLSDTQGDGSFGAPKRVPSLLGVKDTAPWAWGGDVAGLEEQVAKSVRTTMRGRKPAAEQARAIAAYLGTLAPPPALGSFEKRDAVTVRRGRDVFERHSCGTCHAPPAYTSARAYNVGLVDEVGNTHFNPPSLRGVSQGGPYFHDGRAATLDDVFARHRHQVADKLSPRDVQDLLTFLRTL